MTADTVGMLIRNEDGSVAWAPWERLPAEAVCPKCGEPICWCLDMFSFTTGFDDTHRFTLTHARCAWTADAFARQAALARAREILGGRQDNISVRDAARILDVHENTIRNYIAGGDLPAETLPGSGYHRLRLSDLLALPYSDRPGYREEWRPS